ncbi:MAG: thymidine kinase [Oscillospiraceae bacterium]|jgi:thymidine kinase|nr:thymidine kinase [Oscillospiraceae bacterium]
MAKLYFRYGAMNSGKTANLLMVADNYIKQDKNVIILKPDKDTRWNINAEVKSRAIVTSFPAILINDKQDLYEFISTQTKEKEIAAILVEEAQFLTAAQVRELALVVDDMNIPVLCYGLKCSYLDGKLLEGSAALLYWADTIEEIKNVCQYCTSKATKNLLRINGIPQYEGDFVVMGDVNSGDDILFTPVCRRHYLNPPKLIHNS